MTRVHKKGIFKLTSWFLRNSLANISLEELFLKKNEVFLAIAWIVSKVVKLILKSERPNQSFWKMIHNSM